MARQSKRHMGQKVYSTESVDSINVDTAGNVGIGTESPSGASGIALEVNGKANTARFVLKNNTTGSAAGDGFQLALGTDGVAYIEQRENNAMVFSTNLTERMRIAGSGDVLIGTTSALAGGQAPGLDVLNASGASTQIRFRNSGAAAGRYWRIGSDTAGTAYFINDASAGVYISYGNTGWTGLSDERHKTDLKAIENAAVKVASLRAVTGRYKTDEEGKSRAFLIAQDVEKVLPEAVDTSNEERWGITYTDTIPLLVAAIQELKVELDQAKAELAALRK
jgi:hypothetical protein